MVESSDLKRAVISGASKALEIKEKNPKWNDSKVIQQIAKDIKEIISKLG